MQGLAGRPSYNNVRAGQNSTDIFSHAEFYATDQQSTHAVKMPLERPSISVSGAKLWHTRSKQQQSSKYPKQDVTRAELRNAFSIILCFQLSYVYM